MRHLYWLRGSSDNSIAFSYQGSKNQCRMQTIGESAKFTLKLSCYISTCIDQTQQRIQACSHAPPRNIRKNFLTRHTVKNGISNLYISLKMQEMPFQRPKIRGSMPRTPLQLCRHYGLSLTKILATLLTRRVKKHNNPSCSL